MRKAFWRDPRAFAAQRIDPRTNARVWRDFKFQLENDMNTPLAITVLEQATEGFDSNHQYTVYKALKLLGFTGRRTKLSLTSEQLRKAVIRLSGLSKNEFADLIESAKRNIHFPSGRLKPEAEILDLISHISFVRRTFESDFLAWEQSNWMLRHNIPPFADSWRKILPLEGRLTSDQCIYGKRTSPLPTASATSFWLRASS